MWTVSWAAPVLYAILVCMSDYESGVGVGVAPLGDDYWRSMASWYTPGVHASEFARIVDLTERTIQQYAVRPIDGFPEPLERGQGHRNRWSYEQIFTNIERYRPGLLDRIPRCYTSGRGLKPAVFLFAEAIQVSSDEPEFVVHHWLPSDGRGKVAIAYVVDFEKASLYQRHAVRLLEHLDDVTAVAIPTSEITWLPGSDRKQLTMVVADHTKAVLPEGATVDLGARRCGWFDVANLLRVDIPWWPFHLRDPEAMKNWFPGVQQAIRPRGAGYHEGVLNALLPAAVDCDIRRLHQLVENINRRKEANLLRSVGVEDSLPFTDMAIQPGITLPARSLFRIAEVPDGPTEAEASWMLHQKIADPVVAAEAMLVLQNVEEFDPIVEYTIRTDATSGLSAEWVSRLARVHVPDSLQFGFAFARSCLSAGRTPESWWVDPRFPDTWIVRDDSGRWHSTVGYTVPARGHLAELQVEEDATFFRDSDGTVWPMPAPVYAYYLCGYGGTGPRLLNDAVHALRKDAALDTRNLADAAPQGPLWEIISGRKPTLYLDAAEIDRLVPR